MRWSFAGHFIPQRELHRSVHSQGREVHVVFVVEHNLLAIPPRFLMVHAAIACFAGDLVERATIVAEDAEKGSAA